MTTDTKERYRIQRTPKGGFAVYRVDEYGWELWPPVAVFETFEAAREAYPEAELTPT